MQTSFVTTCNFTDCMCIYNHTYNVLQIVWGGKFHEFHGKFYGFNGKFHGFYA